MQSGPASDAAAAIDAAIDAEGFGASDHPVPSADLALEERAAEALFHRHIEPIFTTPAIATHQPRVLQGRASTEIAKMRVAAARWRSSPAAFEDFWEALDLLAQCIDAQARHTRPLSPAELAEEMGHRDDGQRIRGFLRDPDDGRGPFQRRKSRHWRLQPDEADRVRERFR